MMYGLLFILGVIGVAIIISLIAEWECKKRKKLNNNENN